MLIKRITNAVNALPSCTECDKHIDAIKTHSVQLLHETVKHQAKSAWNSTKDNFWQTWGWLKKQSLVGIIAARKGLEKLEEQTKQFSES
ncbi:unnamed protein product [Allacma fusca]|uniref:Uncharacterized protein n=1 Tax=Allacma fusca TaxID=39272 RepID=A0A8J2K9X4_9HEXA|nr:unnamed protein product [Allacma fusca]